MSAPKEPQPIGTTTGKRGYIRTCVRCGKELQGAGRSAKYCLECRAEVNREMSRRYQAEHPDRVRASKDKQAAKERAAAGPVYCQRCGREIPGATHHRKWCPDCKSAIKAQQSRESWHRRPGATRQITCQRCGKSFAVPASQSTRKYCDTCRPIVEAEQREASRARRKEARSFAGPYMTDPRPADVAKRAAAKAETGEARLHLLTRVADWAGMTYGKLMALPVGDREMLILQYKALHHVP